MSVLLSSSIIRESGVKFGTSGARGLVTQFTDEVCAAFTCAFIECLKVEFRFNRIAIAIDNRPSSYRMAQACAAAAKLNRIDVEYYGVIPTPALAYTSMQDKVPCIMVTGSHIPFDRNGLKFYRPDGEISKVDEQRILSLEIEVPELNEFSELKVRDKAAQQYMNRYTTLFSEDLLAGKRIGIYEHSSSGRDLYPVLFEALGAEVISLERTDEFVPIDTEAVSEADKVKARDWSQKYALDFIFSTDGDGDRPLVSDENGEWLRGDILGLLCSEEIEVEALAIPISCNTVIGSGSRFRKVSKTKIGSPYVIAEFEALSTEYDGIAGFEANGGYLLGSDIKINGKVLKALPTRDAVLPALMLLSAAQGTLISKLVADLPQRFTHSDRIQNFATEKSVEIVKTGEQNPTQLVKELVSPSAEVSFVDTTDGLRINLADGTIVHLRPSGNAPELRCYAEADSAVIAQQLVESVLSSVQKL